MTKNIRNLALAAMSGFRHKTVDVPEWEGATVVLREPSAEAWLRWQEIVKAKDDETPLTDLLCLVAGLTGGVMLMECSGNIKTMNEPSTQ
ncbi:hypothetical protein MS6203_00898 [Escherichia coli]|nr:hypothetical protein [Escherichia coli]